MAVSSSSVTISNLGCLWRSSWDLASGKEKITRMKALCTSPPTWPRPVLPLGLLEGPFPKVRLMGTEPLSPPGPSQGLSLRHDQPSLTFSKLTCGLSRCSRSGRLVKSCGSALRPPGTLRHCRQDGPSGPQPPRASLGMADPPTILPAGTWPVPPISPVPRSAHARPYPPVTPTVAALVSPDPLLPPTPPLEGDQGHR